jgi:hypothetical protein
MQLSIRILLLAAVCLVFGIGCDNTPASTPPSKDVTNMGEKKQLPKPVPPPDLPPLPAK